MLDVALVNHVGMPRAWHFRWWRHAILPLLPWVRDFFSTPLCLLAAADIFVIVLWAFSSFVFLDNYSVYSHHETVSSDKSLSFPRCPQGLTSRWYSRSQSSVLLYALFSLPIFKEYILFIASENKCDTGGTVLWLLVPAHLQNLFQVFVLVTSCCWGNNGHFLSFYLSCETALFTWTGRSFKKVQQKSMDPTHPGNSAA